MAGISQHISIAIFVVLSLPAGKLMARVLPRKSVRVPATNWEFSLNPGPFNIKEHALVFFLANCSGATFAMEAVVAMDLFYHRKVHPLAAISLILTVQLVGYGLAGFFMKIFVESPKMWFPGAVANVAYFRALHEKDRRVRGKLTQMQFFIITSVLSFAYYIIPGYYFPSITALSFACWKWKDSVLAQQIGSGINGLGLGSFAFDWATIVAFNGSPFDLPTFSIANSFAGYLLILCVVVPIAYWSNLFDAKRYPIISSMTFDANAREYNASRILDDKLLRFNEKGYDNYSKIHLSISYVFYYGMYFATAGASISHLIMFHGRTICQQLIMSIRSSEGGDIHNRLMKRYPAVPLWWFLSILLCIFGLSIYICEGFGKQFQLPIWIVFLSLIMSLFLLIPSLITNATTGQTLSLDIIPTLIITYIYPGRPLADYVANLYSTAAVRRASSFLGDFKVGHYMKIPPRAMFIVQIVGTSVTCLVNYGVYWWLFSTVDHLCEPEKLPKGSPWTCPVQRLRFNDSIIWTLVGPRRVFFPDGEYKSMYLFFLVGILGPCVVWGASKAFPAKKWIELIDLPLVFNSAAFFPAGAVNLWSWSVVGLSYNLVVLNKFKDWWVKYNYMLSSGLEVGIAFMGLLMMVTVNSKGVYGPQWWGSTTGDHCPLATCPTALGSHVEGCPSS